jgi:hypothetical protein
MSESEARQKLMSALLAAVQQCQVRYGGKSELATENEEVNSFVEKLFVMAVYFIRSFSSGSAF